LELLVSVLGRVINDWTDNEREAFLRGWLEGQAALIGENQKLREALSHAVSGLKAVDRIGHHVYTNADNEFAPMHWADADKLVHVALVAAEATGAA
jgi:hypothetical protein